MLAPCNLPRTTAHAEAGGATGWAHVLLCDGRRRRATRPGLEDKGRLGWLGGAWCLFFFFFFFFLRMWEIGGRGLEIDKVSEGTCKGNSTMEGSVPFPGPSRRRTRCPCRRVCG
jgi:hypothetical protein